MKESPEGLVPARGFLEDAMKPRPSFNDGSKCGKWIFLRTHFCWVFGGSRRCLVAGEGYVVTGGGFFDGSRGMLKDFDLHLGGSRGFVGHMKSL